jgi:hypothetical protein
MDEKVIKIGLSVFQGRYNIDVPVNIMNKADALKKSCSCFDSYYDPKMIWEKKLNNKKEKSLHIANNTGTGAATNKGRFHIIIPDFSVNSCTKRALIGYLNKLTAKNKETIYVKIKAIIDNNKSVNGVNGISGISGVSGTDADLPDLKDIFLSIWSYIKATDSIDGENNIYIKLLEYFDSAFLTSNIDRLWDSYLVNKEWIPPKYIFENNLLLLNNEYELYCDYIKWKKGVHNLNIIWIKYKPTEISVLLNDIYGYLTEKCIGNPSIHKYIIDIFIEQILKILNNCNNKQVVKAMVEKMKLLDVKSFDSSTRFLIYNIIENK